MLFLRQELLLPELSQKSHVSWYLEQFYWKIHVNICTFQGNKSVFKKILWRWKYAENRTTKIT